MSSKDYRFKSHCPICEMTLPGTDDAIMEYESLKEQVEALDAGEDVDYDTPGCGLCGDECPLEEARLIIAKGPPAVVRSEPGDFDD